MAGERLRTAARRALAPARWRALLGERRVRAVGHLLTGTAATVGITLITVGLAARALGPAGYGVLALVLTLGQACERLLSFQSWQPLIRYGAALDSPEHEADYRSLLKFGLLLDLGGGALAWAVASLLVLAGRLLFNLDGGTVLLALAYMVSLLFNLNGISTAIFRLTGQFRLVARVQVINAMVRLACVAAAFAAGAGLASFVLIWAVTQALGSLANFATAWWLLRRAGRHRLWRASLAGLRERFPGLWRFALGSNLSLSLWASAQQVDTLLVGWLADPVSAGLFHIAKRISRVVQQVGSQVESVVYPDLSRLAAAGEQRQFNRVLLQTEAILAAFGGACFLGALLLAPTLLRLAAGPGFAAAAPLLTVQILAVSLTISGAASRAALLAKGAQSAVLRVVGAATATFYLTAPFLVLWIGAMGANVAHVLFGTVWLAGLTLSLRRLPRQTIGAAAVA